MMIRRIKKNWPVCMHPFGVLGAVPDQCPRCHTTFERLWWSALAWIAFFLGCSILNATAGKFTGFWFIIYLAGLGAVLLILDPLFTCYRVKPPWGRLRYCSSCGYDLSGHPSITDTVVCPECGRTIQLKQKY